MLDNYRKEIILSLFLLFITVGSNAQVAGDYRTKATGNWTTISIWERFNGTAWVAALSLPAQTNDVTIQSGNTVTLDVSPQNVKSLFVQSGAKLFTGNTTTNLYLTIWGTDIVCDGIIGNAPAFDGISFNIESGAPSAFLTTTISGSGIITLSRIRKNQTTNPITNLIINTNVALRWDQSSNTQLYNNATGTTKLNVTVNAGAFLNCTGSVTNPGNIAIDGVFGTGTSAAGGTLTINGTVNVSGKAYLTTNNPIAGDSCSWIVNNGGVLRVNTFYVAPSGAAGNRLRVAAGGRVEINGSPGFESTSAIGLTDTLPTWNNIYFFSNGSFCEYTGLGMQYVPSIPTSPSSAGYGFLKISGSGTKYLIQKSNATFPFRVYNDFEISNATGSPVFDCLGWSMTIAGSWFNYNQSGFAEGSGRVTFNTSPPTTGISTINCSGGETFNLLTYQKLSLVQVRFNTSVTINDRIEWFSNGAYDLNGNDLILKNRATSAILSPSAGRFLISERTDNASRVLWFIGTIQGDSTYTIPFGKYNGSILATNARYIPFIFKVYANTNPDTIKAATYATPATNLPWPTTPTAVTNLISQIGLLPDNRDATVDRFWQVNSSAAIPPSIDMTFTYTATELPIAPYNSATSMGAQYWNAGTGLWQLPVLGTGVANSVTVTATNFYGPWTLVNFSSPLPVELISFEARPNGRVVELNWATASELNNDRFEIERSADGRNFQRIGQVSGVGNSTVMHNYEFRDEQPVSGISYYRLRQVDFNGDSHFGNIAAVNFRQGLTGNLYPQPALDQAYWQMSKDSDYNHLIFSVLTPAGQLVKSVEVEANESGRYALPIAGLSDNLYFLVIETDSGMKERLPLLIQH